MSADRPPDLSDAKHGGAAYKQSSADGGLRHDGSSFSLLARGYGTAMRKAPSVVSSTTPEALGAIVGAIVGVGACVALAVSIM